MLVAESLKTLTQAVGLKTSGHRAARVHLGSIPTSKSRYRLVSSVEVLEPAYISRVGQEVKSPAS
jgi:hypothetical protein